MAAAAAGSPAAGAAAAAGIPLTSAGGISVCCTPAGSSFGRLVAHRSTVWVTPSAPGICETPGTLLVAGTDAGDRAAAAAGVSPWAAALAVDARPSARPADAKAAIDAPMKTLVIRDILNSNAVSLDVVTGVKRQGNPLRVLLK
ncbi:Uncharacterised protein [Mycobacteroides abscessus subsp. abscessus]|nr:Uncharacterised protein [Mycobacteroides abscessus subsp. abscessus]